MNAKINGKQISTMENKFGITVQQNQYNAHILRQHSITQYRSTESVVYVLLISQAGVLCLIYHFDTSDQSKPQGYISDITLTIGQYQLILLSG